MICRFLPYRRKGVILNSVNSPATGPNVTRIVRNAEKFILFNLLKSELRYYNPLQNDSATKEIGPQKNADFGCRVDLVTPDGCKIELT